MTRVSQDVIDHLLFCVKGLGFEVGYIKVAEREYGSPTVILRLQTMPGSPALRDSYSIPDKLASEESMPERDNDKIKTLDD